MRLFAVYMPSMAALTETRVEPILGDLCEAAGRREIEAPSHFGYSVDHIGAF